MSYRGERWSARRGARWMVVLALVAGCATSPGQFVWMDQLADGAVSPAPGAYQLRPGDLIAVQVFNHPEVSGKSRVRDDGKVSIALLGDLPALGKTPVDLARDVERELVSRSLAVAARGTVLLEEMAPLHVSVLGEVIRPGLYPLGLGAGLSEALASAGGFTEFAHRDRLFVVRRAPDAARIRFTYQALVHAEGKAAEFRLRSGDVVVVE